MFARAYFLGNEIYTKNAKFFFIDLAKLSINNDNVIPLLFSSCHHIIIVMSTIAPINICKLPYICICSRVIAISLYRSNIVSLLRPSYIDPILTHCDPRKSPIFPIFVTRFCDRPIYRPIYRPI